MDQDHDWQRPFVASAMYFEDSDSLEYVSEDGPCIFRRVDEMLTLMISVGDRRPIGIQLKGFKNFYLRNLRSKYSLDKKNFLALTCALEEAMNSIGAETFKENQLESYALALNIAERDSVEVRDFPQLACGR
ncbi:hypothetical protein [Aurantimonas sp. A3-2-R12]|uniref:hypothetical protein n=1 Tax=Aurantimonas sp. A3-2-R12 TaxID=3114362 RepID=UPI002E175166|nr:hypothetical protein [Aurantimonas sp. A3-2-R12]